LIIRLGPQAHKAYKTLRQRILDGEFGPGSKLPSHARLAGQCGVALLTVRQAISRLEQEGMVSCVQGLGSFVRAPITDGQEPPTGRSLHADPPASSTLLVELEQAKVDLRESEERVRLLFTGNPQPMWIYDLRSLRFLDVNEAAIVHYGYSREEFLRMRISDIRTRADQIRLLEDLAQARPALRHSDGWHHRLKDGRLIDVEITSHTLTFAGRQAVLVLVQDIAERKQAEEALRDSEERLTRIVETIAEGIVWHDIAGRIIFANPAAEQMLGVTARGRVAAQYYAREWQLTTPDGTPLSHDQRPAIRAIRTGKPVHGADLVFERSDGTTLPVSINATPLRDTHGTVVGAVTSFRDITEVRGFQEQLKYQALHDALTGLPNRTLLHDRLEQAILASRRNGEPLALLLMDLDHFKEVNDTFGHHYGDLLLQQVQPRLRNILRASDTIARLGGDEFAVLLLETDGSGAYRVAEKILEALSQPFLIEEHALLVEPSIGIALYPEHGEDTSTLLRHADISMYTAKRTHSGYALYEPEQDRRGGAQIALISGLRRGIDRDEMLLHYQPKVDFRTGTVSGLEALVRWQHPQHGLILPGNFIPHAEQTGLIKRLGFWVLKAALTQCRAWYDAGISTTVAVNLSTRSLHDPELARNVARLIRMCAVAPTWLEVEITESVIMENPDRALNTLTHLHDLGVRIGIDDFGTGYSSLAYLKRLPADEIKIDRSFVKDMTSNESDAVIVRSVIDLGHNLGLRVVAEGVESRETWDMLAAMGCDVAQGYYLSPPFPAEELGSWLNKASPIPSSIRHLSLPA